MRSIQGLSEAEREIMQVIWKAEAPVTAGGLLPQFPDKGWKIQTMSTFLTRLVEKGVLHVEKQGKSNLYSPTVDEQGYHAMKARQVVDSLYHGSMRDFLAAFYGGGTLDKEELDQLRAWFEEAAGHD